MLTKTRAAGGWTLRLTDITPFTAPVPSGATFTRADLNDGVTILRLAEGCGAIVHLGGVSVERPFEESLGPKIRRLHPIQQAGWREQPARGFASIYHLVGLHESTESLPPGTTVRAGG